MTSIEQRRHLRLRHRAKIRVLLPAVSEDYIVDMRDFSESGLFLQTSAPVPIEIGSIIQVQTTEFEDAPIQKAKVVRHEAGKGFAVEFVFE